MTIALCPAVKAYSPGPASVCLILKFWVSLQINVLINEMFMMSTGNGLKPLTYCHTQDQCGCYNIGLTSALMS